MQVFAVDGVNQKFWSADLPAGIDLQPQCHRPVQPIVARQRVQVTKRQRRLEHHLQPDRAIIERGTLALAPQGMHLRTRKACREVRLRWRNPGPYAGI